MPLVFVYGTLKAGFPNHALNTGRRVGGRYVTREKLPLWVVRLPLEDRAPWLLHAPGQGHPVVGEVYEVDEATLAQMDRLEEVDQPQGYRRVALALDALDGGPPVAAAQAWLKPPGPLTGCLAAEGPYPEYTLALAAGYWLRQDDGPVVPGRATAPPGQPDHPDNSHHTAPETPR